MSFGLLGQQFRKDESAHNRMVIAVAAALTRHGVRNVQADALGYSRPGKITWNGQTEGHIPDVQADGIIIEVETEDTIDIEHTRSQCKLFEAFARPRSMRFVVVVPTGSKLAMQTQLLIWGITGEVWEA